MVYYSQGRLWSQPLWMLAVFLVAFFLVLAAIMYAIEVPW
jgi:hypothetical protein